MQDAERLLLWRNDPAARRWSPNQAEISPVEHARWLTGVLTSVRHLVLVAEADGEPVGSVRFAERDEGIWEVSVVLDPAQRGRGLARASLTAGEDLLLARAVGVVTIQAVIHRDNGRSLQLFGGCGYKPIPGEPTEDYRTYVRVLPAGKPGPR
jgi:RimJ/RimL family protein N-acetyltransferase